MPRLVSWPRLKGGVRRVLRTTRIGPGISTTAVGPWSLFRRPPWRASVSVHWPSWRVLTTPRTGDGDVVKRSAVAAHRTIERATDADAGGFADGFGVVQDDDGVLGLLADQLGEQQRAIAWGATADVVAEVDQDDGVGTALDGLGDGLLALGQVTVSSWRRFQSWFERSSGDLTGREPGRCR